MNHNEILSIISDVDKLPTQQASDILYKHRKEISAVSYSYAKWFLFSVAVVVAGVVFRENQRISEPVKYSVNVDSVKNVGIKIANDSTNEFYSYQETQDSIHDHWLARRSLDEQFKSAFGKKRIRIKIETIK